MSGGEVAAVLLQVWIAATGLVSIALLQFGGARSRRWAPFIGLAGQPAWLWHSIDANALRIGIVSAAYTVVWLAGCINVLKEIRRASTRPADRVASAMPPTLTLEEAA